MGPYERGSGVTSAEQRGPSVCNVSFNREGKDEMTKASIDLQDLRRRLYVKAKAETSWRFWGLYVHICKMETRREASRGSSGRSGTSLSGAHIHRYRPGGRRYRRMAARSAFFRYLRSVIGWCKARSSSYWSRSLRLTSNQVRLDIVPNGQLMTRSTGWREQSFSTRHALSISTCAAILTMS